MRATFTIAVAFLCGTAAAAPQEVTCESPCSCSSAHGKGRWSVKNDPETPPKGVSITIDSMTVRFVILVLQSIFGRYIAIACVNCVNQGHVMGERQMKTYLVVMHNGKWLLALDQNTIISNP